MGEDDHWIVRDLRQKTTAIAETEARHKRELAHLKEDRENLARQISTVPDMTARLNIARVCYEEKIALSKTLSWALFGNENKIWHMHYALRPPTKPCSGCGEPTPTDKTNFLPRAMALCDRCQQRRREEAASRPTTEERREHYLRRHAELSAKAHLSEDEVLELADIILGFKRWSIFQDS
jgi:hypothetical protein